MKLIVWCCVPISIFSYMLFRVIGFAREAAPVIGWVSGIYLICLCSAFLILWVGRLILAIHERRTRD
jgi:hypothetical protein